MEFYTENYKIKIIKSNDYYTLDSANKKFENVYYNEEIGLSNSINIYIYKNNDLINSALLSSDGVSIGVHNNSVVIESNRIVICCGDSIFCLSIPDLKLLWKVNCDWVCCFQIFKYEESYIIHGEIHISRISNNGEILWKQSGRDIFTTIDDSEDFKIYEKYIYAKDFLGNEYKYDFKGIEIK